MSKPVSVSVSVPVTNKYTEKLLSCQGFFPLLFEINACHTTFIQGLDQYSQIWQQSWWTTIDNRRHQWTKQHTASFTEPLKKLLNQN